jgi:hypothetical protein
MNRTITFLDGPDHGRKIFLPYQGNEATNWAADVLFL